ncbi:hypothetical protein P22_0995 [Propionispora sp. 2/2-37]|uniref:alcohol dehydrogenase catalytic domain-containing protein n=1 Tax=Propionispora sp. 2/2-37 TaxID=1677858 RepID=UPI0006C5EE8F|nr:alcohol dehydrogenase catalytic domain-containing protein [Propionispora sp. 2/2-37]CUH94926.1 hypothetical protein P22_0995 [Propionispora sp. 2/2-37]
MGEKMLAMVLHGPGNLVCETIDRPKCGRREVLIRVKAVGLCGSDIRTITFGHHRLHYPQVIGHEIAGEVVETGNEAGQFTVGDRVYVGSIVPCHRCEPCRRGWHGLCENIVVPGSDIPGGYAEYMVLTGDMLDRGINKIMPDHVSYEEAVLVEPLSSVYACQKHIDITLGDVVVIIGAGPVGCLHVELAKLRGAGLVIVVEQSTKRLNMAKQFGTDYVINSSEADPVAAVKRLTGQWGADKVISACPALEAQQQAVAMTRKMGKVVFFGGVAKGTLTPLDTNLIHYNLLTVYGHYAYSEMDLRESYQLVVSGKLNAKKYITHTLPLREIEMAIKLTRNGDAIKVVLIP